MRLLQVSDPDYEESHYWVHEVRQYDCDDGLDDAVVVDEATAQRWMATQRAFALMQDEIQRMRPFRLRFRRSWQGEQSWKR